MVSRNSGQSFKQENVKRLFGSFFFVSEDIGEHSRAVKGIMISLADIGGFIQIVLFPLYFLLGKFNDLSMMAKNIRSMFFEYSRSDENKIKNDTHVKLKPIKFSQK